MWYVHKWTGLEVTKSGKVRGHLDVQSHNGYINIVYPGAVSKKTGRPRRLRIYLHRLMMETFVGRSKKHVNHKDGDKFNNRLSNLEYVTRARNAAHAHETGLLKAVGKDNGRAVLTERDVIRIRELDPRVTGVTGRFVKAAVVKMLMAKYSINKNSVYNIWNRATWAHL